MQGARAASPPFARNGRTRPRTWRYGWGRERDWYWETSNGLGRWRHRLFVPQFFAKVVYCMSELAPMGRKRLKRSLREIAVSCLVQSGYQRRRGVNKVNGDPTKHALKLADYLLGMPRIQAALDAGFTDLGFTTERMIEHMKEIAFGEIQVSREVLDKDGGIITLHEDVAPGDRLKAMDMRIKATMGYAPVKAAVAHIPPPTFNPDQWGNTPAIATTDQDMRRIHARASRTRRGGKKP